MKVLEGSTKVESASLMVAELLLDGNPSLTSSDAMLANDILQLNNDRPKDPGEDHTIHQSVGRDSKRCHVDEHVVVIALQYEEAGGRRWRKPNQGQGQERERSEHPPPGRGGW